MNYVRTFFEKPLVDVYGEKVLMLDFCAIHAITDDGDALCLFLRGRRNAVKFEDESKVHFLSVFAEYCRDMQSLERGPVRLGRAGSPSPPATEKAGETPDLRRTGVSPVSDTLKGGHPTSEA